MYILVYILFIIIINNSVYAINRVFPLNEETTTTTIIGLGLFYNCFIGICKNKRKEKKDIIYTCDRICYSQQSMK